MAATTTADKSLAGWVDCARPEACSSRQAPLTLRPAFCRHSHG